MEEAVAVLQIQGCSLVEVEVNDTIAICKRALGLGIMVPTLCRDSGEDHTVQNRASACNAVALRDNFITQHPIIWERCSRVAKGMTDHN